MAKAKKAETYEVPALVVTPDKAPVVTGNFDQLEKTLEKWAARVSTMDLTEDNMDEVQVIKKAAVAVRNQLDAKIDETKKLLFNDPKKIFEARMKPLYALVGDVEGAADKVLDKLERERIEGVNKVLDLYKSDLQEQYKLGGDYFSKVEYRKNYYNKTVPAGYPSMDKFWKTDLEQQFKDLKKEQAAYEANVRLIEAACKDEPRLNAARYVKDLAVSDVASIVEEIAAEKQRLREIDQQPTQTVTSSSTTAEDAEFEVMGDSEEASVEDAKKVVLGIPSTINFNSDFPGRNKTIRIEITYPCDLGDAFKEMFEKLRPYGITIKELKKEVAF
jgi:hypothetical protein